uniref:(northern house mosquito) hypothetical protein n=1 Tax=Culex pipiens TaxID=7175 RepID=A0A8D8IZ12_CULPI
MWSTASHRQKRWSEVSLSTRTRHVASVRVRLLEGTVRIRTISCARETMPTECRTGWGLSQVRRSLALPARGPGLRPVGTVAAADALPAQSRGHRVASAVLRIAATTAATRRSSLRRTRSRIRSPVPRTTKMPTPAKTRTTSRVRSVRPGSTRNTVRSVVLSTVIRKRSRSAPPGSTTPTPRRSRLPPLPRPSRSVSRCPPRRDSSLTMRTRAAWTCCSICTLWARAATWRRASCVSRRRPPRPRCAPSRCSVTRCRTSRTSGSKSRTITTPATSSNRSGRT